MTSPLRTSVFRPYRGWAIYAARRWVRVTLPRLVPIVVAPSGMRTEICGWSRNRLRRITGLNLCFSSRDGLEHIGLDIWYSQGSPSEQILIASMQDQLARMIGKPHQGLPVETSLVIDGAPVYAQVLNAGECWTIGCEYPICSLVARSSDGSASGLELRTIHRKELRQLLRLGQRSA